MTITSDDNPAIRELRKLRTPHGRSRSDLFVAEGEDLVEAASSAGWVAERVLVRAGSGLEGEEVEPRLLDSVSAIGSGTRVVAIYRKKFAAELEPGLLVHLDRLSDPGNVGTIVRSADAFGACGLSFAPGTADPFGPKAVRASMGAIFRVPVTECASVGALPGTRVGLTASGQAGPLPTGDIVLVVGSEREGLSPAAASDCDLMWSIPIAEGAESLNAAVACSLALHLANRIPG